MTATLPPAPKRVSPGVVFAAGFLLTGVVAAQTVTAIGSLYAMPFADRLYADRAADENDGKVAVAGLVALTALSVLAAVVYAILTPLTTRGLRAARVLTWITIGLTVVTGLIMLALAPYSALGWYHILALVTTLVTLLFAGTAGVLLALPAARRYFRRTRRPAAPPPPVWPQPPWPPQPPPPTAWPQPPWPPQQRHPSQ